jgi:hypothetical protein
LENRQYNGQIEKKTKGQTMIYKTIHRKLKVEQHESRNKQGDSGAPDGQAVPDH